MHSMSALDLAGRRVLIREDFNVPMKNGAVADDTRLRAALPTLKAARDAGATVMLMSHLGRPTEGQVESEFSLAPVAERLAELMGSEIEFRTDWIDGADFAPGSVTLLENVRFLAGEKKNDDTLAQKMAALCDVFVNDAFAAAHRCQPSLVGFTEVLPMATGLVMERELRKLGGQAPRL